MYVSVKIHSVDVRSLETLTLSDCESHSTCMPSVLLTFNDLTISTFLCSVKYFFIVNWEFHVFVEESNLNLTQAAYKEIYATAIRLSCYLLCSRYIAICWPMKVVTSAHKKRSMKIGAGLWILAFVLPSPLTFFTVGFYRTHFC